MCLQGLASVDFGIILNCVKALTHFPLILISLILAACVAPTPPPPTVKPAAPAAPASLDELPILPTISPKMSALYKAGLAQGNNPRVFTKLGDCMTDNPDFLRPLAEGKTEWADYAALKAVIEQFKGVPARSEQGWRDDSFTTTTITSAGGFNVAGPLDATWADPKWCKSGENPLSCEYRLAKPSIAVIMFGTNDVTATELPDFERYLREILDETLKRNIVPLLHTFPSRPENPEKSVKLNQIVVKVARELDVPLVNFQRAIAPLPNKGVDPNNTTHLSLPAAGRSDVFSAEGLKSGANMRNLVTLQALDLVLKAVK